LSSECSVVSFNEQAFVTPPGYVGTDQALGFSLHGCRTDTEESIDVELDFGIPLPPNGLAYKVDGDSFRLIPGATVRGSSVRYTIVDNGELDQNSNLGEIEDPVAVLVPLPTTPSTPVITATEVGYEEITLSISVADTGNSPIVTYRASCTDGQTTHIGTNTTNQVTVKGLANDKNYTCTATVTNEAGYTSGDSPQTDPIMPEYIPSGLPAWLLFEANKR
jgi:hypothetical protein